MLEEIIKFNEIEIDTIFYHKNRKYIKIAGQCRPTRRQFKGSYINAIILDRENVEFKKFTDGIKIQLKCITIDDLEEEDYFKYYGKHNKLLIAQKLDNSYSGTEINVKETIQGRTNIFFLEWDTPVIPLIEEEENNVT